eukprot:CAMPEP_0171270994 /NCGR_PEP_ID=MMETSP0790-20130122/60999_1 /TAXON_ID=2925 /ORGANISM="Alexandrium catenella, Strain OF101" /LENGTH=86 /DNA_ID=CAMNT_0011739855 /DNA_START=32 /DNA_END=292 /DNA_ORIENTATION=-
MAGQVFADFDKDKSGKLEKKEVQDVIEKLAESVFEQWKKKQPDLDDGFKNQLRDMLQIELDSDFSGDVTKEEFVTNIMKIVKDHGA